MSGTCCGQVHAPWHRQALKSCAPAHDEGGLRYWAVSRFAGVPHSLIGRGVVSVCGQQFAHVALVLLAACCCSSPCSQPSRGSLAPSAGRQVQSSRRGQPLRLGHCVWSRTPSSRLTLPCTEDAPLMRPCVHSRTVTIVTITAVTLPIAIAVTHAFPGADSRLSGVLFQGVHANPACRSRPMLSGDVCGPA